MKYRAAVVLGLSLAACSGHAGPAVAPLEPVAMAATTTVVARPGEQMTYNVSIHNVDVAELLISVGQPETFDGKDAIVVQTHATSSRLLTIVRPVDDTLTSWIDRATGQPLAFKAVELGAGEVEDTETRFAPGKFPVHAVRGDLVNDDHQIVRDVPYDVPSMLTFLRGWDAPAGTQVSVDVMRSRHAWRTQIVVGGFENLATALGELPAIRYDGEGTRLLRDGTLDPRSDTRRFSIWITDDADRVPAKLVAHTDYGDIKVELVGYRAQ